VLANECGISILDIQKVNYAKLKYEEDPFHKLNRSFCFFKVRGNTYNIEVGFVLRISRESLI
jgi:hypothetical protein